LEERIESMKTPQGLLLHCGGRVVGREELMAVPTPIGTDTWYPLDHGAILEEVEGQLGATGFTIEGERRRARLARAVHPGGDLAHASRSWETMCAS